MVHVCQNCGETRFPPAAICARCMSFDQVWRESSGEGVLESWIEFHRAYWDRYKDGLPYSVCLVRLSEGPLLVSNLVGDTASACLGAPVHVVFQRQDDGLNLPKFVLDVP